MEKLPQDKASGETPSENVCRYPKSPSENVKIKFKRLKRKGGQHVKGIIKVDVKPNNVSY